MKSSENEFHFFTCILTDYVAHESPKEFWKNIDFENVKAGFLLRFKTHFGKLPLEMMHDFYHFNQYFIDKLSLFLTEVSFDISEGN